MYMPVVVSSGSSVRILYPRESYDSWADPEGPVRTVCQSTTDVVVDCLICCTCLILLPHIDVDVPVIDITDDVEKNFR
jgi:hypothetical protein